MEKTILRVYRGVAIMEGPANKDGVTFELDSVDFWASDEFDAMVMIDEMLDDEADKAVDEALANEPVTIHSTKMLQQYMDNYNVVISADDIGSYIEDDDEEKDYGITKYLVTFDLDNQNIEDEFDTEQEAYEYAIDNIESLPEVTKCWQSDTEAELGDGDDYDEEDISYDDPDLARMLNKITYR